MKRVLIALPVIALLAAGCNSANSTATLNAPIVPAATVQVTPATPVTTPSPTPTPPNVKLEQIGDLQLFTFNASTAGTIYYQVENFSVNGTPLILASTYGDCNGSGCLQQYFRFLKESTGYVLLTKYSAPLGASQNQVSQSELTTKTASSQDVPALDIPTTLAVSDPTLKGVVAYDGTSLVEGNIFDGSNKTLVFSADGYGVYALNGSNQETFYVESADGKELIYNITPAVSGKVVSNTGVASSVTYFVDNNKADFCEAGGDSYSTELDAILVHPITLADLTSIGKMDGGAVYELSNPNSPLLTALQSDSQLSNSANNSGGGNNEAVMYPKVSQTSILFWADPFGRLIRLIDGTYRNFCGA